ncbi:MAG: tetratricopeptide repeat protein, partial [Tepidisphaeraceae bacterium]
AKVLDAGTTDTGRPYFVMEYVPGEPITQFCDVNKLSIKDRLELFKQTCEAINHAHTKAIIHRDIKAGNVLAYLHDNKPVVKVIDFGIAKALTGDKLTDQTFNTERGQVIGTYETMSPEQADGSPDIDTRTDVYSLGVLLYELLSGTKPFDSATLRQAADAEIKRIIREVEPPRPSTKLSGLGEEATKIAAARREDLSALARQLHSELEWIPLKAIRKERDRRYASPLQLAEDIQNYFEGKPLIAGPESKVYRTKKFLKRHRAGIATSVAMVLLLIAGVSFYIHNIRAEQRKTIAALQEVSRQKEEAQRLEREAKKQAEIAEVEGEKQAAVNEFLNEMLASANPKALSPTDQAKGRNVTILEVLDTASKKLDAGSLEDQPVIEATVRSTLGRTYQDLGEYALAELNLTRALTLTERVHGEEHADVASALADLGVLRIRQGKLDEAEPLLRRALEIHHRFDNDEGEENTLNSLATMLQDQGKLAEAEALFRQSLELQRKRRSSGDPHLAMGMNNLAVLLYARGKLPDAEALFREVLTSFRKTVGDEHPEVANTLNNLGVVLQDQNKLSEAEPLIREAVSLRRRLLGSEHPDVAQSLHNLSAIMLAQGKPAEAETLSREALAINRHRLGNEHPLVMRNLSVLAWTLRAQEKYEEAESFLREALAVLRKTPGTETPAVARQMLDFANLLREEGKLAEAESWYRQTLTIRRRLLGPEHEDVAVSLNNLANVLRAEQKLDEAESIHREALAMFRRVLGDENANVATSLNNLGDVLRDKGQFAECERLYREALELRRKLLPAGHPDIAQSLASTGQALRAQGKLAEAEPMLDEAVAIRRKQFGVNGRATTQSAGALADLFDQTNRPADAAALRKEYGLHDPMTHPATMPATRP